MILSDEVSDFSFQLHTNWTVQFEHNDSRVITFSFSCYLFQEKKMMYLSAQPEKVSKNFLFDMISSRVDLFVSPLWNILYA